MNSGLNPADPTLVAAFRSAAASTWSATAGRYSRLTTLSALVASAPGRECGLASVNAVSFGQKNNPVAAGGCARQGVAGVFADDGGTEP